MKPILIILALVLAVGLVVWLCSDPAAPAKPVGHDAPVTGIVDGIQVQLDAKVRVGLAVKLANQRNQLKQTLAMEPVDAEVARAQLKTYDDLVTEVAAGKQELVTRGTPPKEFEDWLATHQWDEIQSLAKDLRGKLPSE